jgi:hypothetical protein
MMYRTAGRDFHRCAHQKSARMNVWTTSDKSTMIGHKPEPSADINIRLPSRI